MYKLWTYSAAQQLLNLLQLTMVPGMFSCPGLNGDTNWNLIPSATQAKACLACLVCPNVAKHAKLLDA